MEKNTGIIIAAGLGTRIGELTRTLPKPLLEINSKPIISYAVHFLKTVGVHEIVVVGGYKFPLLKKSLEHLDIPVSLYENPNYHWGNLYSLEVALNNIVEGGFLLTHPDHIFQRGIAEAVQRQMREAIVAFTDHDRKLHSDDMKIKTDQSGSLLKDISKKLSDYSLGYVGLTYCPSRYLVEYKRALTFVKQKTLKERAVTEDVMRHIAQKDSSLEVHIGDISGFEWHEIDTLQELFAARNSIETRPHLYF